jgi:hypothetical protein
MKFPLLALTTVMLFHVGTSSPTARLKLERPLTAREMETVVGGIRQALAGKTLRLVDEFQDDPEILMGRDGMPQLVRFKGRGESVAGITTETGTARVFNLPDVIVSVFEYSRVPARRCNGGPAAGGMAIEYLLNLTTKVHGITTRELAGTSSLLPLRWEVFQRQAHLGAIDFVYEQIDLRRPAGAKPPTCIP